MKDIDAFLESYRQAWRHNSPSRIESHWDKSAERPFYKAEEIQHIITDWDELRAYWDHNEGFNERNELGYSDVIGQRLSEELLLVGLRMRWDIRFAKGARQIDGSAFAWAGKAMGGDNHVIACLRHDGSRWSLRAWVEAPDAPILYMADLYMKNVRPDFRSD